jgi:hypothetical protein
VLLAMVSIVVSVCSLAAKHQIWGCGLPLLRLPLPAKTPTKTGKLCVTLVQYVGIDCEWANLH